MTVGDDEVDAEILAAIEGFPWVAAVYALDPSPLAAQHPDVLRFAVVVMPYGARELAQTHYSLLDAMRSYDTPGRVLYVDGRMPTPVPLRRARRMTASAAAKASALERIFARRKKDLAADSPRFPSRTLEDIERSFRMLGPWERERVRVELACKVHGDTEENLGPRDDAEKASPYRYGKPLTELDSSELQRLAEHAFGGTIVAALAGGPPFAFQAPARERKRLLIIDPDTATKRLLAELSECDVTAVEDAWAALDQITARDFDLVLCALTVGDVPGAKVFRLAVTARAEIASRFVFLASEHVVAGAPPSSMGRVLPRPLDPARVRELLARERR
jgi:CheY-like chemotaxis protein